MRPADIRRELPPLLRLAWPLVLAELGWIAMSLVDTVLTGRLEHSAVAMSAASLAQVLFNTLAFGIGGTLLGLDTLISQAFGAKQINAANRWLLHGVALAVVLAVAQMTLFSAAPMLLLHLPVDRDVLLEAVPAMRGLLWGTLPLLLYFTLRRYLQAAHHTRPIAFALVSANLLNVAGDWLLMFGHRWHVLGQTVAIRAFGVTGSSWSTSFARVYMAMVMVIALVLADRKHAYGLRHAFRNSLTLRGEHGVKLTELWQLLRLGAPAGAQIFVEIAIFALVTCLIATFGPLALAGHEVALQCASTTFMVPLAISSATSVRVGHAIGRLRTGVGTIAEVVAAGWCGIGAGATFMLTSALLFVSIPGRVAHVFTPDPGVIHAAVPLLLIAAGFQFFDGLQITATGALRGAGKTLQPFLTLLVAYWVIGMPAGMWLGFHERMGAAGLWWGLLVALVGAAATLLTLWRRTTQRFASL